MNRFNHGMCISLTFTLHLFHSHQRSSADVLCLVARGERSQADLLTLEPFSALTVGLFCFGMTRQGLRGLNAQRMDND